MQIPKISKAALRPFSSRFFGSSVTHGSDLMYSKSNVPRVEQYSMADDHSDWLKFAASCMSDVQWEVAAIRPEAVLSHRSCPWGGHLIKLEAKTLGILAA